VLQIVTRMYFDPDAEVHTTLHRGVLYTNCQFMRPDEIELPVGSLLPATERSAVTTVTVAVTEHLEAAPAGSLVSLTSTGGLELLDDLGVLLSFGLNAVFSRNHALVTRLVPDSKFFGESTQATTVFGPTFEARRFVSDEQMDDFRAFMTQLLSLKRPQYDAAMRAIRRIVGATQRAADDPTLAYVDIVAALESLSKETESVPITWERLDGRKRKLIDPTLASLDQATADGIRNAILTAEYAGLKARYVAFVIGDVTPSFYREEATGIPNPVRGAELERLTKVAYDIRSVNVHSLTNLRPEAWLVGGRMEAVTPPTGKRMLTHSGLLRLARHVVRNYVTSAPTGVDPDFDWRAHLPNLMQFPIAPQYLIHAPNRFDHTTALTYFSRFLDVLVETLAGRLERFPNVSSVIEQIEQPVSALGNGEGKTAMVAVYALWHNATAAEHHRPAAADLLRRHGRVLDPPSVMSFAVGLISRDLPAWSAEQWRALASDRRQQRSANTQLKLPAGVDAALQVYTARQCTLAGDTAAAAIHATWALEELPGNTALRAWEPLISSGQYPEIDLVALALGVDTVPATLVVTVDDGTYAGSP
jgi:hypothetical protein